MATRKRNHVLTPSAGKQERPAGELGNKCIPVDVVDAILSKLPVKSLIRFQTLSKSYRATIFSPRFSKINYIHQSNRHDLFVSLCSHPQSLSLLRSEGEIFRTEAEFGDQFEYAVPISSCNGIVLLLNSRHRKSFVLWNPSIRRCAAIPIPALLNSGRFWMLSLGLYHDSRRDDYKVVIICDKCNLVYSCKARAWAEEELIPCTENAGELLDGHFYWRQNRGEIFSYNLRERKIEELKLPEGIDERFGLGTWGGRLCLYPVKFDTIWVRENERWKEMEKRGVHLCNERRLGLIVIDDDCYFLAIDVHEHSRPSFVVYNDCEKRFEERTTISGVNCINLISYSESLFFPF